MLSTRDKVDKSLTLVVPCSATRDYNKKDLVALMETYALMERAKEDFLDGLLTFDEYLQLAEMANINVDSYMEDIEHNLLELKLI